MLFWRRLLCVPLADHVADGDCHQAWTGQGPVIFRQFRKGFNGQQFVMLKFRTMTVQENGATVTQATRNDPRVTGIGKLLRASSIDELPQLINVLSGEMSLDRTSSACFGARQPVRKIVERLCVPPPCEARNYGLGAVQWRARRNAQD